MLSLSWSLWNLWNISSCTHPAEKNWKYTPANTVDYHRQIFASRTIPSDKEIKVYPIRFTGRAFGTNLFALEVLTKGTQRRTNLLYTFHIFYDIPLTLLLCFFENGRTKMTISALCRADLVHCEMETNGGLGDDVVVKFASFRRFTIVETSRSTHNAIFLR